MSSPRALLNNIFTGLFHYLLPLFRQLHHFIFPNFLKIFFSKDLFEVSFIAFQGTEIFSVKNFVKTKINEYLKVQWLVNTADESELPRQAVTVFAWSSKKHAVLPYPDERLCIFCQLILDAFHQALLSVGLIASSIC